jgi:hypothetical protein
VGDLIGKDTGEFARQVKNRHGIVKLRHSPGRGNRR